MYTYSFKRKRIIVNLCGVIFFFPAEAMEDKQEVIVSGLKMMLNESNNKVPKVENLIKNKCNKITQTLFLQIFGHAAFIKQKVR